MTSARLSLRPRLRAIGLTGAGALFCAVGAAIGVGTLVWFGASLLLLVVFTLGWSAYHALADRRREVVRSIVPPQLQVGRPAHTQVGFREGNPPALAAVYDDIPQGVDARVENFGWAFVPVRRGRLRLGPVRLHRGDPFGLFHWRAALRETDHPIVWPRTDAAAVDTFEALSALALGGRGAPTPDVDDVSLREYRHGDPLARVHWKRSAQHGSLLVRRDEPGHTPQVNLVLVPGSGRLTDAGVDTLAAAAATLGAGGNPIRLLTPAGVTEGDLPTILTALALTPADSGPLPSAAGAGITIVALATTELEHVRRLVAWVGVNRLDPNAVFVFPCAQLHEPARGELAAFTVIPR